MSSAQVEKNPRIETPPTLESNIVENALQAQANWLIVCITEGEKEGKGRVN